MSSIVNWEYYSSLHNKVSSSDFSAAEALAEKDIIKVVGQIKWANITSETFGYSQLKDCICEVIDFKAESVRLGLGKGVTSVSNDGYSESFSITSNSAISSELESLIKRELSGTGLVGAY